MRHVPSLPPRRLLRQSCRCAGCASNLDTRSADDVFSLFRKFNVAHSTTVLFVTHNPTLAARCDKIIRVVDGQLMP